MRRQVINTEQGPRYGHADWIRFRHRLPNMFVWTTARSLCSRKGRRDDAIG
jgi:hypothetical protein